MKSAHTILVIELSRMQMFCKIKFFKGRTKLFNGTQCIFIDDAIIYISNVMKHNKFYGIVKNKPPN